MSESKSLMDVALAVDALIDEFGTGPFEEGISEGEADQRRREEEFGSRPTRLIEHGRTAEEDETLRTFKDEDGGILLPPHESWVRG